MCKSGRGASHGWPRIDLFIFHFLVMQTGRELAIGHIFQEFRDWRDQSAEPLETFLSELKVS
jgi:hypothetical protein